MLRLRVAVLAAGLCAVGASAPIAVGDVFVGNLSLGGNFHTAHLHVTCESCSHLEVLQVHMEGRYGPALVVPLSWTYSAEEESITFRGDEISFSLLVAPHAMPPDDPAALVLAGWLMNDDTGGVVFQRDTPAVRDTVAATLAAIDTSYTPSIPLSAGDWFVYTAAAAAARVRADCGLDPLPRGHITPYASFPAQPLLTPPRDSFTTTSGGDGGGDSSGGDGSGSGSGGPLPAHDPVPAAMAAAPTPPPASHELTTRRVYAGAAALRAGAFFDAETGGVHHGSVLAFAPTSILILGRPLALRLVLPPGEWDVEVVPVFDPMPLPQSPHGEGLKGGRLRVARATSKGCARWVHSPSRDPVVAETLRSGVATATANAALNRASAMANQARHRLRQGQADLRAALAAADAADEEVAAASPVEARDRAAAVALVLTRRARGRGLAAEGVQEEGEEALRQRAGDADGGPPVTTEAVLGWWACAAAADAAAPTAAAASDAAAPTAAGAGAASAGGGAETVGVGASDVGVADGGAGGDDAARAAERVRALADAGAACLAARAALEAAGREVQAAEQTLAVARSRRDVASHPAILAVPPAARIGPGLMDEMVGEEDVAVAVTGLETDAATAVAPSAAMAVGAEPAAGAAEAAAAAAVGGADGRRHAAALRRRRTDLEAEYQRALWGIPQTFGGHGRGVRARDTDAIIPGGPRPFSPAGARNIGHAGTGFAARHVAGAAATAAAAPRGVPAAAALPGGEAAIRLRLPAGLMDDFDTMAPMAYPQVESWSSLAHKMARSLSGSSAPSGPCDPNSLAAAHPAVAVLRAVSRARPWVFYDSAPVTIVDRYFQLFVQEAAVRSGDEVLIGWLAWGEPESLGSLALTLTARRTRIQPEAAELGTAAAGGAVGRAASAMAGRRVSAAPAVMGELTAEDAAAVARFVTSDEDAIEEFGGDEDDEDDEDGHDEYAAVDAAGGGVGGGGHPPAAAAGANGAGVPGVVEADPRDPEGHYGDAGGAISAVLRSGERQPRVPAVTIATGIPEVGGVTRSIPASVRAAAVEASAVRAAVGAASATGAREPVVRGTLRTVLEAAAASEDVSPSEAPFAAAVRRRLLRERAAKVADVRSSAARGRGRGSAGAADRSGGAADAAAADTELEEAGLGDATLDVMPVGVADRRWRGGRAHVDVEKEFLNGRASDGVRMGWYAWRVPPARDLPPGRYRLSAAVDDGKKQRMVFDDRLVYVEEEADEDAPGSVAVAPVTLVILPTRAPDDAAGAAAAADAAADAADAADAAVLAAAVDDAPAPQASGDGAGDEMADAPAAAALPPSSPRHERVAKDGTTSVDLGSAAANPGVAVGKRGSSKATSRGVGAGGAGGAGGESSATEYYASLRPWGWGARRGPTHRGAPPTFLIVPPRDSYTEQLMQTTLMM